MLFDLQKFEKIQVNYLKMLVPFYINLVLLLCYTPPLLAQTHPNVKVVGGVNASEGQFPFALSLQMKPVFGNEYHFCGGVIVDTYHVITAAHCIHGRDETQIEIVAGAYNLTNSNERSQQRRKILLPMIHPDFDPYTLSNDLALLLLDSPLIFNSLIQPIVLPNSFELEAPQNCTFVGWGSILNISPPPSSHLLQKLNMTIVPTSTCQSIYEYIKPINQTTMICAKGLNDEKTQGPCEGDSGSVLLCPQEPNDPESSLVAVGLMSWSMIPCGDSSYPSVFTNILSWDMLYQLHK